MQVCGLPGHLIRNARAASRLLDAEPLNSEAARRRDAVARWRRAMQDGVTREQAAVGAPRALCRWRNDPEPKSRDPVRSRNTAWPPTLVEAVERLRLVNPMWGRTSPSAKAAQTRPSHMS